MLKRGVYKHYKNKHEYKIVCFARNEADGEDVVVYEGLYDKHLVWVRPLSSFTENVEYESKIRPRFEWLRDQ